MKILIVEDEMMARNMLARTITANFPDTEIVGMTGSIKETVQWLDNPANKVDVIFMDIELSDGTCFEIFRQTDIKANVIMTTAYDSYAIKAFEAGSIDYLLKPIEPEALKRALSRCHKESNIDELTKVINQLAPCTKYKERYIVKLNDHIIPICTSDIAYIYSEDKYNYLVTTSKDRYIIDSSLDIVLSELDPDKFFRISRSCIIAMRSIKSLVKQSGGKLRISASPAPDFDLTVSRSRVEDFISWLER